MVAVRIKIILNLLGLPFGLVLMHSEGHSSTEQKRGIEQSTTEADSKICGIWESSIHPDFGKIRSPIRLSLGSFGTRYAKRPNAFRSRELDVDNLTAALSLKQLSCQDKLKKEDINLVPPAGNLCSIEALDGEESDSGDLTFADLQVSAERIDVVGEGEDELRSQAPKRRMVRPEEDRSHGGDEVPGSQNI